MIWGLQPGPMLFKDKPEFVWGLIASTWIGLVVGLVLVLAFAPLFAAVLRAPFAILMPIIVFVCAMGAYAVNNRMMDVWYMIIFGIIGFIFKKLEYNMAPMLLALVLGDMAEQTMRQSLIMSQGSPWIFLRPPIALPINLAGLVIFFWPLITMVRQRRGKRGPADSGTGASGEQPARRTVPPLQTPPGLPGPSEGNGDQASAGAGQAGSAPAGSRRE